MTTPELTVSLVVSALLPVFRAAEAARTAVTTVGLVRFRSRGASKT
ncbi:hypothetical protein QRX50_03390 [Amycolatopsis carbonis]|uniref:Uncharacterized protein n=1 Tax=Amycolatopsis carbonis TaxID=715471 RepID=A0A9Y2IK84_9PSEU|nr:hypothetical protein [Amycolatopsis sp. 2-15]WIX79858.1 hypothetical protein QRX50_03390 [Amycolatopsis sp. 2-15]